MTLHEASNMRREAANRHLKPFLAAHAELSRMTSIEPIYAPTGEDVAGEFEDRLRELFEVLPLDGADAVEAFRREARRLAPARLGKGGRDSAIWLTVAKLANDGNEIFFVTDNTKDFGHGGLYTELLAEVAGAPHPIQYLSDANEFVSKIATSVSLRAFGEEQLAAAFASSIRSEVIRALEADDSPEHTVDRALAANVEMRDVRASQGYVVDGHGLALIRATTTLADPTGVQWSTATLHGWLEFEVGTFVPQAGAVERLADLTFR
ncbi:hypothetical protein CI089_10450 [Microbacterium sp. Yaish 1]|nr:hypothetical protein CI089_10450 [Microbacterium sp. Yaish 1]